MNGSSSPQRRVNVLGVGISPIHYETACQAVLQAVRSGQKGYICVTGVHGVSEAQQDPAFRDILNRAFLVTPDGMPMVWYGRMQGHDISRVYGPTFMLKMCELSVKENLTHFFYGGGDGVAEKLRDNLCARFPGLQVTGTYTPPFRPLNDDEREALRQRIADLKPDMIWVGLSTPKQERFMAEYLPLLDTKVMAGVGAAFDFHAGLVPQAPAWMQKIGMEWFYRLCKEPKRLWKRYLKNNPLFIGRSLLQALRLRRYTLPEGQPYP